MTPNPTLDQVLTKVRTFLLAILPVNTPVIRGPVNLTAQPAVDHVIFTPIIRQRLRTNQHTDDSVNQETTTEEGLRLSVQLDFYGGNAGDWSTMAETLWRDEFAVDILSPEASPLYTDTANMVPLVTGEEQFLERFVLTAVLQWNPQVVTTQQSATSADVGLINVDVRYPPT